VVIFNEGKRIGRWGEFDTWGSPQEVPNYDHMGPGAQEKLGAPVLLQTLALYSCMTFENAKVAKIGEIFFFKLK